VHDATDRPGRKAPAFTSRTRTARPTRWPNTRAGLWCCIYPKDDTPGCTTETCEFRTRCRSSGEQGRRIGRQILDEKSKAKFAAKHKLTFPLLADADHAVAEKYGVWQEKSRYGRKYMGIVRTTYLIGADGKVLRRWDNVKVDGHAEDVLAALKGQ
jgi:peroxiredoxin Q/BCP